MTVPGVSKNDSALARLRNVGTPLDVDAARVLYAVAASSRGFHRGRRPRPGHRRRLQQRGIIRRRARAGYLELTDDARFSLMPE